jgi:cyclopropane-fatty-acyl-phospholipid synthase
MLNFMINAMERGWMPDSLVRVGIRRLCGQRLASLAKEPAGQPDYVRSLRASPVAVQTQAANEQHYELPAEFFSLTLGKHKKYSCGYWPEANTSLDQSEQAALDLTFARAELANGQEILELGCGWGSITLAMAEKFPGAKITAVSNSSSQRAYIEAQAKARGLANVTVLTRDVATATDFGGPFDRVVSVEMFEHMRNYGQLFSRVAGWLKPGGKAFVHIFTHRKFSYLFETEGEDNWMGRYFFTGGQMPSRDLFSQFSEHLKISKQWEWNGTHYQKTSEAWLKNQDAHRDEIMKIFRETYGKDAVVWFNRWRVFFLAVAELFGYADGKEWGVTHYLFEKV